jgi:uncharacterized protein YggE
MLTDGIQRTVRVTGIGRVAAVPDVLLLDLAVETQAVTASAALAENNKQAAAVLSVLEDHGIQDGDIQTTQLSINPVLERQGPDDTNPSRIVGYQARNGLSARLRDLQGAGTVIDAAVQAGGDAIRIDGISFLFANTSELLIEARKRAVDDGRVRAQQLADGFGVKLGNVISISESNPGNRPLTREFAVSQLATPISPSESEIALQVVVDYEIAT